MRVGQAVVLIGGLGTRLGVLTRDVPKPLLDVDGRPFLEYVVAHLARFGVTEILLLAGYHGALVRERYDGRRLFGATIAVSIEPGPLGTAGALVHAADRLGDRFLLCNGDTFFDADLLPLLRLADDSGCEAAMLLREVDGGGRYGCVDLGADGAIRRFLEKPADGDGPALINSGIYLVRREPILAAIDATPASLERDVFPKLVARGALRGVRASGYFVDIGIPDDLAAARTELPRRRTRPAVFLDRDGVLNLDAGYTHRPGQLEWVETAPAAVRMLNEAGFYVLVVTNQAGVARGYYDEAAVRSFHAQMQDDLLREGAHVDGFYHCPHHPDGTVEGFAIRCDCRKPEPGLLRQAASDWPIDASQSFLVGDKDSDLAAAAAFGVRGVKYEPGGPLLAELVAHHVLTSRGHDVKVA